MPDLRPKRIAEFIEPFRVEPGRRVRLPPRLRSGRRTARQTKAEAKEILAEGIELLAEYQERLAAQDTYGVLVVLQAMDAAGKDGTIRHVMSGVNPQGVQVSSFKVPSVRGPRPRLPVALREEAARARQHRDLQPLLLRGGPRRPGPSRRSWPARSCRRRRRAATSGTAASARSTTGSTTSPTRASGSSSSSSTLSKEEQRRRFLARIDLAEKNWKFSANDAKERAFWDDYQKAFSEVLSNTSTAWAPWYVIPADDKPFARVAAAGVLANALIEIDPQYPKVSDGGARRAPGRQGRASRPRRPKGAAPDPIEVELAAKAARKKADGQKAGERRPAGRGRSHDRADRPRRPDPRPAASSTAWYALSPDEALAAAGRHRRRGPDLGRGRRPARQVRHEHVRRGEEGLALAAVQPPVRRPDADRAPRRGHHLPLPARPVLHRRLPASC